MQDQLTIANRQRQCYLKRKAKLPPKPADPISEISREELAYIAGIIDGDGCIRIGAVGTNRRYKYPIVIVAMTHLGVIQWLTGKLSSGTIKLQNYTKVNQNPNWKKQYGIFISGNRAKMLCQSLLPFLKVKIEQAKLICQFPCDDRRGRGKPLNKEVFGIRNELAARMKKLNRRGPNEGSEQ